MKSDRMTIGSLLAKLLDKVSHTSPIQRLLDDIVDGGHEFDLSFMIGEDQNDSRLIILLLDCDDPMLLRKATVSAMFVNLNSLPEEILSADHLETYKTGECSKTVTSLFCEMRRI